LAGDGSARQRAEAMRWLAFVNSDVHPAFSPLFSPGKFIADESQLMRCASRARSACANCRRRRAAGHARLAGRLRSIADPYFYITLRWADVPAWTCPAGPHRRIQAAHGGRCRRAGR
jgi:glutathione S-transferase